MSTFDETVRELLETYIVSEIHPESFEEDELAEKEDDAVAEDEEVVADTAKEGEGDENGEDIEAAE